MILSSSIKRTKLKYITITFTILFVSILLRLYYDKYQTEAIFKREIDAMQKYTALLFNSEIRNLQGQYLSINKYYQNELDFNLLIKQRDRLKLYEKLKSDYYSLKELNPHFYVMHIFDKNNTTILRMHKPQSYDDNLTNIRPIVREVNREKVKKSGFEVGKNGMTYRITIPYTNREKEHIGVIEYGINPSYFIEKLRQNITIEAMILVKTDALSPLTNKIEKKKIKKKKIGVYSIIQTSSLFEKISSQIDLNKPYQILNFNNKSYLIENNLELNSFRGEDVAKIIVAHDITSFIENHQENIFFIHSLNLFILILIASVIIYIFNIYTATIQTLSLKAEHYETKAITDNLTGLYNREYLNRFYPKITNNIKNHIYVCVLFDIDHFKHVNDTYGHVVGDQVLNQLSKLAQDYFRKTDILIRYGGEEFILFIKDITYPVASTKIENFRKYIEATNKFPHNIKITISVGVGVVQNKEELNLLVDRVDKLLYQAKESGRNRVIFEKYLN